MAHSPTERPLVLVVEDEFLIRTHAAEVIRDAGYEVIEASNADEAILLLETRQDIRVVFTDIQMPGTMDGLKLAHAVHIIATSGHHPGQDGDFPLGTVFLPKPYSHHQIESTLDTLTAPQ